MVTSCCVKDCYNRQGRETHVTFHRFPKIITHHGKEAEELSRAKLNKWLKNLNLKHITAETCESRRVCSLIFYLVSIKRNPKPFLLHNATSGQF